MAVNSVQLRRNFTSMTDRWLSPNVWADFPFAEVAAGTCDAHVEGDDFKYHGVEDSADDVVLMFGYDQYIDTSNTIRLGAATAANYFGFLELVTDATDNDAPVIHRVTGTNAAGAVTAPFFIGNGAGPFPLWFECRIKKSSVADNTCAFAIGLASGVNDTRAADNGLLEDDTGDIVDSISFIGFRNKHDNGEELDFVYQDGAQTAPTEAAANCATLAADTYVKLGFYYNPNAIAARRITLFVDNAQLGTYVTQTNIDTSTFPEDDMMGFVFGTKNGAATATTGTIDWWRCAQVYSRL
jgi:hypothetical protein